MIKFPITDIEVDLILSFISFVVGDGGGGFGFLFLFVLVWFWFLFVYMFPPLNLEERIQIKYKSGKIHVDMKSMRKFACSKKT